LTLQAMPAVGSGEELRWNQQVDPWIMLMLLKVDLSQAAGDT